MKLWSVDDLKLWLVDPGCPAAAPLADNFVYDDGESQPCGASEMRERIERGGGADMGREILRRVGDDHLLVVFHAYSRMEKQWFRWLALAKLEHGTLFSLKVVRSRAHE